MSTPYVIVKGGLAHANGADVIDLDNFEQGSIVEKADILATAISVVESHHKADAEHVREKIHKALDHLMDFAMDALSMPGDEEE